MPVEISVGPPTLTINQGSTFMVTDLQGEIAANSELGIFARDTRFVSYYSLSADGAPWKLLTSSTISYYRAQIHLTNPALSTEHGEIAAESILLTVSRSVGDGVHEDLDLVNYANRPVRFNLELAVRSDFADIFEVKARRFVRRGRIESEWRKTEQELRVAYMHRDFVRQFVYRISNAGSVAHYANGRISFAVTLGAAGKWHACGHYVLDTGKGAPRSCTRGRHLGTSAIDRLHQDWLDRATRITTSNEDIYRFYRQSVQDMGALRLHEEDFAPDLWLAAAGVPWFVTVFGRDSLIASLQNMMVDPTFALGALKKLAELQSTTMDDWRDAEPGKMPHEMRYGELARLHKIPHTPYYGTADATILYLIVLHETWRWLGDPDLLRTYRDAALGCLEWIDRYGDLDGDGFQEYRTRSPGGYENMGWKDAHDAVMYPDGSPVPQPKALCELQGYVFDAWVRMAEVFRVLGEPERAAELASKAERLQERFEEAFWCEEMGCYAYGLDPQKRQIKTVASNPGHCLWSGIASREHAARVVERLLAPDMWSGWGIRTLSANHPGYNPFSYQRGSVWPHDNALIALGFRRYGHFEQAARVVRGLSEAASYFVSYRMPELYAGVRWRPNSFPVMYPDANVPQAWAAGSIFHGLQAILGLEADAQHGRLLVAPRLPKWLGEITLHRVRIGNATVTLRCWREGESSRWEVLEQQGSITVEAPSVSPTTPAISAPATR
jgi:glycogen debranching enzyme